MSLDDLLLKKEMEYGLLKKEKERLTRAWSNECNRRIRVQQSADKVKIRYEALIKLAREVCKWTLREDNPKLQYQMEEMSRFIQSVDGPVEWYT